MRAWNPPVDERVVTEGCGADRSWPHAPRLVPAGETDDGPRQVPDFAGRSSSAFTVAGTAPDFRRLPFEPPPADLTSVGGTLVDGGATRRLTGCQIALKPINGQRMTSNPSRLVALLCAIFVAAALRLVPHPPNFSPIDAMALFSGAYLGRRAARVRCAARRAAAERPRARLLSRDGDRLFQRGADRDDRLVALKRRSPLRVGAAAIASSVLFFVVTNFGMWLFSGMYPHTLAGLDGLLCRGDSVLPEHGRRRPVLRGVAVRRLPHR